jgi:hypothetical protein
LVSNFIIYVIVNPLLLLVTEVKNPLKIIRFYLVFCQILPLGLIVVLKVYSCDCSEELEQEILAKMQKEIFQSSFVTLSVNLKYLCPFVTNYSPYLLNFCQSVFKKYFFIYSKFCTLKGYVHLKGLLLCIKSQKQVRALRARKGASFLRGLCYQKVSRISLAPHPKYP